MFTKKVPKSESASKLLTILTKRSSFNKIQSKKGIYDEWPTAKKPSLFNYPNKYIKYVNQEKEDNKLNTREKSMKKQMGLKKVPATFSTCTTMEFYSPNQQKIRILSKFISTPQSQDQDYEDYLTKNNNLTQYFSSKEDQSEIIQQSDIKNCQFDQQRFQEINCRYIPVKRTQQRKSYNPEKRQVKTAKLNRQKMQPSNDDSTQLIQKSRKSSFRQSPKSFKRPKTAKTNISNKFNQPLKQKSLYLNTSKFKSKDYTEDQQPSSKYPLRLKDYETNFHTYKVISDLIDDKMKWQPKRIRPKSSVPFKKIDRGLKY